MDHLFFPHRCFVLYSLQLIARIESPAGVQARWYLTLVEDTRSLQTNHCLCVYGHAQAVPLQLLTASSFG